MGSIRVPQFQESIAPVTQAISEKMQKEGALMAEGDRAKQEKQQRDEQREFSRKAGEFQDDASQRRNEEIGKVQRFLAQEINTYSAAQGYDVVIGESFYVKPTYDITAQMLRYFVRKVLRRRGAFTGPRIAAALGAA